jgi:hypothetical protein
VRLSGRSHHTHRSARRHCGHRRRNVVFVRHRISSFVRAVRESEPKHRPLPAVLPITHAELSLQGADAAGQREQAQPGASRTALRLLEGLEDDVFLFVRQPDTRVLHHN